MKNIQALFREKKIRVTPQRLATYKAVSSHGTHLSSEEIYHRVRKKMPNISLATVYATTKMFVKKDLIVALGIDLERLFYDARLENHAHFLCRKCKKIYDVELDMRSVLRRKSFGKHAIDMFKGYFYGVCKDCLSKPR